MTNPETKKEAVEANHRVNFNLYDPIQFLALGFGSGLSPKAPGTFGTLIAIPLFYFMAELSVNVYAFIVFLMAVSGVYICGKAAKDMGVHDHPAIVWDEIVGYLITMFMIPWTWHSVLLGFVLFRIFDIFKPWPISYLDKNCHGGFGIMIDDIAAGFASFLCMHLIYSV
ncbi:phosphatidylglycerophosphatase A family protein [Thalassotalea profundi]|uniref:Phosphatidylglycerophosphatase A n=1 Tax=Thalassotalea profundi TaxID=2036687 RepID=A0ABQ3IDM1_9GAMM|nr:phosphatidylglycerophosphatase A [Thalassotalea profundi]GHE80499.1 phosphatidylglycerophosphatase A [Thalassotalea profundi]